MKAAGVVRVPVREDVDVSVACRRGREVARDHGLNHAAVVALETAIAEAARNIVVHAREGEIAVLLTDERGHRGIVVVAQDRGPGIGDLPRAMEDGFSTAGGLGLGLSSMQRLMDEFHVHTSPGAGTIVIMRKWLT